jgi:hypothetical protein
VYIINVDTNEEFCHVVACPKTVVSEIKHKIETETSTPFNQQEISFKGEVLFDFDQIGAEIFRTGEQPELDLHIFSANEAAQEKARKEAMERLEHGAHLKDLDDVHKGDREVVFFALEHNPAELQYAADWIKSDKDLMLKAIRFNELCIYYAAEELWQNFEFMKELMQIDGLLLGGQQVPAKWRSDRRIVVTACENNGLALQFATKDLQAERDIVLIAVNEKGIALKWASEELKSDFDVVLDAVRNNRMAIVHSMGGLREDDDIRTAAGQGPSMKARCDRLKKKFMELDTNGDGYLSFEELQALLMRGNPNITEDECRLLYDQLDVHKDGKVDFHEFCDFVHDA